ncbi:MAG: cellulase family glycosylhydrolase [Acidobacteriota bacterium]
MGLVRAQTRTADLTVEVKLGEPIGPLDHIWSKSAGSDRAAITLREQWRKDLRRFHTEAGLERIRFHGIFNDELGVYAPSFQNRSRDPNWQNVDRVYDGLLEIGVRPLVELTFMPKNLARGTSTFGFYKGNTSPPKDFAAWAAFITQFLQHLVDRYGIEEIRTWAFEVWNEPDLPFFWTGTRDEYFQLYAVTVRAIKAIDPEIKVGGPATSAVRWIPEFLAYCEAHNLPVDFVSTHIYIGDDQKEVFGRENAHRLSDVVPEAMKLARKRIDATRFRGTPLWLTEWASDSPAMIAHVVKGCLGIVDLMSHWTISNTYEELGVMDWILKEGHNGYGMIAAAGIPKPQFNTYKLLHRLGHTRLAASEGPVLASRRADGAVAVVVWNLAEVPQPSGIPGASATREVRGSPKTLRVVFRGAAPGRTVRVSYVDMERGSPYPEWRRLGSPQYPTPEQIQEIRNSAELPPPEIRKLGNQGELDLYLPPEGVALIELDSN